MIEVEQAEEDGIGGTGVSLGDVVGLRSGGPFMTVEGVDLDPPVITCTWFDKGDHLCTDCFSLTSLILIASRPDQAPERDESDEPEQKPC